MTSYSGPLSVLVVGFVDGQGSFVGSFQGSYVISDAVLAAGGALSGTASGDGMLTLTVYGGDSGTQGETVPIQIPPEGFVTSLAAIGLPLSAAVPELGISWTETDSFDALRTALTVTGSGSFDASYLGYHVYGTASASGSLAATSSAYSIAALDAVGSEGSGLVHAYTFTVDRRGNSAGSGSVVWQVVGSGAAPVDGSDFAGGFLPSGILEFAPGETSRTLSLTVIGDSDFEPDEGFSVVLANAPGEVIVASSSADGSVLNDDTTSIVSIAALDADRAEGQSGTTGFTFTLSRTGDTSGSASVGWLAGGSGVRPADGADFVGAALPNGSVTFAPGEVSRTLSVPVAGDTAREGNEGFLVSLVPQSGATLGSVTAEAVIRADEPIDDIVVVDVASGLAHPAVPQFYDGPVAGLERELLAVDPQNLIVITSGPNWFVHTGSGDDAIAVAGGRNVLDGGTGSNFLTGADGVDSFFLDARGQVLAIWSTLVNFGPGDSATIWGLSAATAAVIHQESAGAPGYTGLTLHAQLPGHPFASLTLPGYAEADFASGRLTMSSGHDAASGSDFIYLVGA